jgi:hypothetical protein
LDWFPWSPSYMVLPVDIEREFGRHLSSRMVQRWRRVLSKNCCGVVMSPWGRGRARGGDLRRLSGT